MNNDLKINRKALIIVDVQEDFCEGGTLAAKDTESLIEPLNKYIKDEEQNGTLLIYSRDWHPENHKSFMNEGGLWRTHCVAGASGSHFHSKLYLPTVMLVVNKGKTPNCSGYSAFEQTNLAFFLKAHNVREIIVTGIATEYCVLQTALDAVAAGFNTTVIKELTRGIENQPNDIANSLKLLEQAGIKVI